MNLGISITDCRERAFSDSIEPNCIHNAHVSYVLPVKKAFQSEMNGKRGQRNELRGIGIPDLVQDVIYFLSVATCDDREIAVWPTTQIQLHKISPVLLGMFSPVRQLSLGSRTNPRFPRLSRLAESMMNGETERSQPRRVSGVLF